LRETARTFLERSVVPNYARWERDGYVDRDLWREAGQNGLLGLDMPCAYGGAGRRGFRYHAALGEEIARVGATGLGITLHNDVVGAYLLDLATADQKRRWLPGFCGGEIITAFAVTEPNAGSDVQAIRTVARRVAGGYRLTGTKIFVSNGLLADLVVVAANTDPGRSGASMTLFVVERGMPGFTIARGPRTLGRHAEGTAELRFDDVAMPDASRLGAEGRGLLYLMRHLPRERLSVAVAAVASCERMLELTLCHARSRQVFGRSVGAHQHNRFLLADLTSRATIARVFVDRCVAEHSAGRLNDVDAAMAKWWTTQLEGEVADACLQIHGGQGYLADAPIARAWLDSRATRILGGTTEVLKEVIGRRLGL
jgi:alkylation response protein AidB-like acyl-CoA dehydrogenase